MALDDDIAVLARVTLFAPLDRQALKLIAFGAEPHALAAGRMLGRAGEMADGGFVLVSGTLARLDVTDEIAEKAFTKPGTLFGELSLLARCAWAATYRAETECMLLRVPRPLFRRVLEEYPETAAMLEASIRADLTEKLRQMEHLSARAR
jgi:CRP-like cAMP-binding protein